MSDKRAFQMVGAAIRNPSEAKESLWAGTVSALDWLERKPESGAYWCSKEDKYDSSGHNGIIAKNNATVSGLHSSS